MADDFIDRRAAGFGEVVVVERGGVAVPCYAGLKTQSMLVKETVEKQQKRKTRTVVCKKMSDPVPLM